MVREAMMTTNADARAALVRALDILKAADQEGTHKQIANAIESLTYALHWLDDDIAIDSGPVRVGDTVRAKREMPGDWWTIEPGELGKVLGGLGNWNFEVIPVAFSRDTALATLDSIEVVEDANGNPPGNRPATWPPLSRK
jgi:hypothetical protein